MVVVMVERYKRGDPVPQGERAVLFRFSVGLLVIAASVLMASECDESLARRWWWRIGQEWWDRESLDVAYATSGNAGPEWMGNESMGADGKRVAGAEREA